MKVYICYECYYDYCEVWRSIKKIVSDETVALVWSEEEPATERNWREYETYDVELE